MKKNDIVMIYEDAATRQREEGMARLVKKHSKRGDSFERSGLERWEVEFSDEPGATYLRIVGTLLDVDVVNATL